MSLSLISAYTDAFFADLSLADGASGYVLRPINPANRAIGLEMRVMSDTGDAVIQLSLDDAEALTQALTDYFGDIA